MWSSLSNYEKIAAIVILMGSVVDIFQFTWIIKKVLSNARRKLYEHVKKEVLLEQLEAKHDEKFPGIKADEGL